MSASWELRGGILLPKASVPLTDRGFRYGQHFFETLLIRQGRWQFFREHWQRLIRSAQEAGFPPLEASSNALVTELPCQPEFQEWPSALVRIYWTAGDGAPSAAPAKGRFYIFIEAMEQESAPRILRLVEDPGVSVALPESHSAIHLGAGVSDSTPSGGAWKTGNYWAALDVLARAKSVGADEALRFNAKGQLVGACLGNVFYKSGGQWWTPPLGDGPRNGVVREWLLARGFGEERSLSRAEARSIREWLVCNSRLGPSSAFWKTDCQREEIQDVCYLWQAFHGQKSPEYSGEILG